MKTHVEKANKKYKSITDETLNFYKKINSNIEEIKKNIMNLFVILLSIPLLGYIFNIIGFGLIQTCILEVFYSEV